MDGGVVVGIGVGVVVGAGVVVFESLLDLLYKIGTVIHAASIVRNKKIINEVAVFLFMMKFSS